MSNNPKNKTMLDIQNYSMKNSSEDKNIDNENNESDIKSDDCSNINYQLFENNYIFNGSNNICPP